MMKSYFTYILKSEVKNNHYYGHTSDLEKRLLNHNSGLSRFTKAYIPWKLIYFEKFDTRSESIRREKFFKSVDGYKWLKEHKII